MEINKIKKAAEIAKSRTNDKRWTNAIDKAVAGVESGKWIVTELVDHILVTTENGTYHANGVCQCKAYTDGGKQACKHRALYRLIQIANELPAEQPEVVATKAATSDEFTADIQASPRQNLIAEITNIWPRFAPGLPLETELLARFGKSKLDMLDDGALRDVRMAIAL